VKYVTALLINRGFQENLIMKFAVVDVEKRRGRREERGDGIGL